MKKLKQKEGSHHVHGEALGEDEIVATRKNPGWDYEAFVIPDEIYAGWGAKEAGNVAESAWNEKFAAYKAAYPAEADEFTRRMAGDLPANFAAEADKFIASVNDKAESPAS